MSGFVVIPRHRKYSQHNRSSDRAPLRQSSPSHPTAPQEHEATHMPTMATTPPKQQCMLGRSETMQTSSNGHEHATRIQYHALHCLRDNARATSTTMATTAPRKYTRMTIVVHEPAEEAHSYSELRQRKRPATATEIRRYVVGGLSKLTAPHGSISLGRSYRLAPTASCNHACSSYT